MIYQLPEEKKDLIIPLFKKTQPNRSALGCYLNGTLSGKTFVDDLSAPTKAICHLESRQFLLFRARFLQSKGSLHHH